jgi:hypothetical protein
MWLKGTVAQDYICSGSLNGYIFIDFDSARPLRKFNLYHFMNVLGTKNAAGA